MSRLYAFRPAPALIVSALLMLPPAAFAQTQPLPTASSDPSAANRVAVYYYRGQGYSKHPELYSTMESFATRFRKGLAREGGFTAIEVPPGTPHSTSEMHQQCAANRVNALVSVAPLYGSALGREQGGLTHTAQSLLIFVHVVDCYGIGFYLDTAGFRYGADKTDTASLYDQNEIIEIGNRMIDEYLQDFLAFRNANGVKWRNLIRYGIAADPPSGETGLFADIGSPASQGETKGYFTIDHLRPDGLGMKSGLREGDAIVSIDGQRIGADPKVAQVTQRLDSAGTVVVRREQQEITITLLRPASATSGSI